MYDQCGFSPWSSLRYYWNGFSPWSLRYFPNRQSAPYRWCHRSLTSRDKGLKRCMTIQLVLCSSVHHEWCISNHCETCLRWCPRPTVEVLTSILLNLIINPLPILDDKGPDGILYMLADTITDKHRLDIDLSTRPFSPCSNICGQSCGDRLSWHPRIVALTAAVYGVGSWGPRLFVEGP